MAGPDHEDTTRFFISYASPDVAWAEWVAWQIEQIPGWTAVIQAWDFVPGNNFVTLMDDAVATADAVVPVLTEDYTRSDFGRAEWQAFFRQDPTGRARLVVPVRVSDVRVEGLLGPILYVDLVGLNEHEAAARLTAGLRGTRAKPRMGPPFPRPHTRHAQGPRYPTASSLAVSIEPPLVDEVVSRLDAGGVFQRVADWVLADQLPDSGGWGVSQSRVMEYVTGEPVTAHDRAEGGIISTYVALRALRAWTADADSFVSQQVASRARMYLLERQSPTGGFGRYVRSRSGREVHASVRHTAFSIMALIELDGPLGAIENALIYLTATMAPGWWAADAAPALALAGTLCLASRLEVGEVEGIEPAFAPWLRSFNREEAEQQLADLAQTGGTAPLWPPYAGHRRMVLDTALSVAELLPDAVPYRVASAVQRALLSLTSQLRDDGGLPYDAEAGSSDFGMSAFLLTALLHRPIPEEVAPSRHGHLQEAVMRLVEYLIATAQDERAWDLTYSDTVANLLVLRNRGRFAPS